MTIREYGLDPSKLIPRWQARKRFSFNSVRFDWGAIKSEDCLWLFSCETYNKIVAFRMEILASVVGLSRSASAAIVTCEAEKINNTPCKMDAAVTPWKTPMVQVMTPSPGIAAENSEAKEAANLPTGQAEILSKPPLVPLRELDVQLNETENECPRKMEMSSKILPQVKAVAVLMEMPFKERNRDEGKRMIPPHIKVPPKKLFGYPERYKSPTDAMVSPISKGLLARNRRPARTLAPIVPPKALENTFQDVVVDGEGGKSE